MIRAEVERIRKTYTTRGGQVAAVRDISLQLAAGEFVAVCGPSGCGKSTLLLVLGGLLRPDGGRVIVDGVDPYRLSANQRAQFRAAHIGFVFQQFYLVPYLSVADNVLAARLGATNGTDAAVRQRADELLERFGLQSRRHHRPQQLSTGERQRVALARALLNQPSLLLADEPTGNLDRENAEIVLREMSAFKQQGGSILLVTHDAHAASFADRQVNLHAGTLSELVRP